MNIPIFVPALDLLLSDITLPDGDGCDLLRRLRPERSPRCAVALTGHGEEALREECGRAGYEFFVLKPAVFADLLAIVEALRGPGAQARAGEGGGVASGHTSR